MHQRHQVVAVSPINCRVEAGSRSRSQRNPGSPCLNGQRSAAKRLDELFGFWKAAAWDAAVNDRFEDEPRSWHTLVVARLDELGVAAALSTVDKWRNSAPIEATRLAWIDSLITAHRGREPVAP